jgi:HSP20 family protein
MANTVVPIQTKSPAPAPASNTDSWRSLRDEMNRLFDRFSGGFGFPMLRRAFEPPTFTLEAPFAMAAPAVDVTEDDAAYKVTAELPGMTEKDIEVSVSGDLLTLSGEKRQEKEQNEKNYHVSERSYGAFQRSFTIPEGVERGKITADFAKGVLTLTMPKSAKARETQRKIEVKAA